MATLDARWLAVRYRYVMRDADPHSQALSKHALEQAPHMHTLLMAHWADKVFLLTTYGVWLSLAIATLDGCGIKV